MELSLNIDFLGLHIKRLAILLVLFPFAVLAQEKAKWLTDMDKALNDSKKENKHILVYFTGSDWCTPCQKLKTDLFDTSSFDQVAKDYVLLYIDYPRNRDLLSNDQMAHNKMLLAKLNKKKVFPLFKILNSKGRPLDELTGYGMNGDVSAILHFLEENR